MPKVIIEKEAPKRSMLTRLTGSMPKLEGWKTIESITVKSDHVEVITKKSPFVLRVYVDGSTRAIVEGTLKFPAAKWKEFARELYVVGKLGDDIVALSEGMKIREGA